MIVVAGSQTRLITSNSIANNKKIYGRVCIHTFKNPFQSIRRETCLLFDAIDRSFDLNITQMFASCPKDFALAIDKNTFHRRLMGRDNSVASSRWF